MPIAKVGDGMESKGVFFLFLVRPFLELRRDGWCQRLVLLVGVAGAETSPCYLLRPAE